MTDTPMTLEALSERERVKNLPPMACSHCTQELDVARLQAENAELRESLDRCTRPDGDIWPVAALAEIDRLTQRVAQLEAFITAQLETFVGELRLLRNAATAQEQRDIAAAQKAGLPPFGCDTSDMLADEIIDLRDQLATMTAERDAAYNRGVEDAAKQAEIRTGSYADVAARIRKLRVKP